MPLCARSRTVSSHIKMCYGMVPFSHFSRQTKYAKKLNFQIHGKIVRRNQMVFDVIAIRDVDNSWIGKISACLLFLFHDGCLKQSRQWMILGTGIISFFSNLVFSLFSFFQNYSERNEQVACFQA